MDVCSVPVLGWVVELFGGCGEDPAEGTETVENTQRSGDSQASMYVQSEDSTLGYRRFSAHGTSF